MTVLTEHVFFRICFINPRGFVFKLINIIRNNQNYIYGTKLIQGRLKMTAIEYGGGPTVEQRKIFCNLLPGSHIPGHVFVLI